MIGPADDDLVAALLEDSEDANDLRQASPCAEALTRQQPLAATPGRPRWHFSVRRSELEHAIHATAEIVQQDSVLVLGSQIIVGSSTKTICLGDGSVSQGGQRPVARRGPGVPGDPYQRP